MAVHMLLKEYILATPSILYASIIAGIVACKLTYEVSHKFSATCFKSYPSLSESQRVEWNNRVISTVHAVFATIMAVYLVFFSDLFSDQFESLVTLRSSSLSMFTLGVSLGYFLTDIGMIIWFYPSLGGLEYIVHHLISITGVAYPLLTGEGQIYSFLVLISEATTPSINLRWYLETASMKNSKAYVFNGVTMFFGWLVARILLFIYFFCHLYIHFDQIKRLRVTGIALVSVMPVVLSVMNMIWFGKIIKGLKKTLAKRRD